MKITPLILSVLLTVTIITCAQAAAGSPQAQSDESGSLQHQIDAQSAQIAELQEQLKRLTSVLEQRVHHERPAEGSGNLPAIPPPADAMIAPPAACLPEGCESKDDRRAVPLTGLIPMEDSCGESSAGEEIRTRFLADYDKGFLIRPIDPKADPFRLKINGWIQYRHIGFTRDRPTWTDNAGVTRTIRNRNNFDIERARLVFSGHAIDKRLTYFLQLDGDTDGRDAVDFFDYWWAWKFSDQLRLQFGKRKVTAGRQWLLGARNTRLSERPMAADFFRPDRTIGLFATGNVGDGGHYEMMLGNGYRTANRNAAEINDDFAAAATAWWEFGGGFGKDLTDHDCSEDPKLRLGHSFAWAAQNGLDTGGAPLRETDFVRLVDGTRLVQTGALAPGVTVDEFDVYFYAIDMAAKHQGWSINGELYFRYLQDLEGNGALPISQIHQRGFFVEGGRVIVPEKLDWNVRYSQVSGNFGNASEYAGGINWYPVDSRRFKVSFDVTRVDGSPLQNTATEILAGDSGTLFRTQIQAEF